MMIGLVAAAGLLVAAQAGLGLPGGGGAAAASPVSTHPLAANEVLLEVNANGSARVRADLATINVGVAGTGATEAAARAAHDAQLRRVREAAAAVGVGAADIDTDTGGSDMGMPLPGIIDSEDQPAQRYASGITIRLRNVGRTAQLMEAISRAGAEASQPEYSVTNSSDARRRAWAEAVAKARADADAIAGAMGMRVSRIVRVSERVGTDFFSMMIGAATGNGMGGAGLEQLFEARDGEVPVPVFLAVDVALAPR